MPARRAKAVRGRTSRARAVEVFGADEKQHAGAATADVELSARSLGATSIAVTVKATRGESVLVRVPISGADVGRIEPRSARFFRVEGDTFSPQWHSGVNLELGFAWLRPEREGTYALIGLPRDIVLREMLRELALNRRAAPPGVAGTAETRKGEDPFLALAVRPVLESDPALVDGLRRQVGATLAGVGVRPEAEVTRGPDGAIEPIDPRTAREDLRKRLLALRTGPAGLPEEQLFFDPTSADRAQDWRPAGWPLPEPEPEPLPWPWPFPHPWPKPLPLPFTIEPRPWLPFRPFLSCDWFPWWWRCWRFCWLWSRDWWMYHHDEAHTGAASGCSDITSTTAGSLVRRAALGLVGTIESMPCVVGGKIYVGTATSTLAAGAYGGTIYRINLATQTVDTSFTYSAAPGAGSRQGRPGVGSSLAVTGGRVFASGLDGKVYCLDTWLTLQWTTDLRNRDLAHRQPVQHISVAEGWSSPLVVNGRVYVGCGEGESGEFGFVYCLDAATGNVEWLFCTNEFTAGVDNLPNEIPASAASGLPAGWAAANGFTIRADPASRGSSPWSSACYDRGLDRIYIGTGNAINDDPLPDPKYASGLLALDATTGQFRGYFQPPASSSYRASDLDVDVPAGPTLFTRAGQRYVCFGSKNGAFFVLNAGTLAQVAWRQLLPHDSTGAPFAAVDPHGTAQGENFYGVFGSAAVHSTCGKLFVGLGGYQGWYGCGIDNTTTPFLRALDWATLADAWPTSGTNPPKYSMATPPIYSNACEAGLGSPAVVNDLVIVGTSRPGVYALSVADGHCVWTAGALGPSGAFVMGPAVYDNYVVYGVGSTLHVWSL